MRLSKHPAMKDSAYDIVKFKLLPLDYVHVRAFVFCKTTKGDYVPAFSTPQNYVWKQSAFFEFVEVLS